MNKRKNLAVSLMIIAALASSWMNFAIAQTAPAKISDVWFSQSRLPSPISVTSSSVATALPTPGFVAWVCNTGTSDAFVAFGSAGVSATLNQSSLLQAGTCGAYDLNPFNQIFTYIAAVTSSSTSLTVETGSGSPPSTGGGGSQPVSGTVTTSPLGVTTTTSTAAPTAGSFSNVLAASSSRRGCLIQNTGTSLGYVFFGANGSASTSNALQVPSNGGYASCNVGSIVLQDNVNATCQSGTCAFVIEAQ